jgi:GntR family transcriptional regulator
LPSERELAQRYQTARNTVHAAIRLLSEEGLVTAEHGRGVFVRIQQPLIRLGNDRYSPKYRETGLSPFLIECSRQGKAGRFDVLRIERGAPPEPIASRLHVAANTKSVLRRDNVFYADADPVSLVTTYIPWTIAQGTGLLEPVVPHPYGIHGVLEDRGHQMQRMTDEVTSRMPTPDEARRLRIQSGVPVIDLLHTSLDQNLEPYEVTRFVMRADMNSLIYDIPVE